MPDPFQCTLDRSQAIPTYDCEAVTTVDSPRGLAMIALSFWTGLFTAYVLCTTGGVRVTMEPLATLAAMSPWASTKPHIAEELQRTTAQAR
jgi:hypothetical protein